jgi:hypothetical protein
LLDFKTINRTPGPARRYGVNVAMNQAAYDVFSASESASERVMNE